MKKNYALTLLAIIISFASFAQNPISGPTSGCAGATYYFSDSSNFLGGSWSSSNTSVATINTNGSATAIAAGVTTITFTYGGNSVTTIFTVNATPASISENSTSFCPGATGSCTDVTTGGTWSSNNTYVATVSAIGVVTGIHGGNTTIYYTVSGCSASITDTIAAPDPGSLYAYSNPICTGSTEAITDSQRQAITSGGTWTSSNPAIATVDGSGNVTGISAGTVNISYTITNGCGSATATTPITVSATTNAGSITGGGVNIYSGGSTVTLSDNTASAAGTWSSSDPSIVSVNASSGVVTGITTGSVTITYSVDGCGGVATTTTTITVTALAGISGNVIFGSAYNGPVTIWLITYNPSTFDLEAIDSVTEFCSGSSSLYYQFTGLSTDSFRVKAAAGNDTLYNSTGYVPTYHTSSFYWNTADVIYYTSGSNAINENINMATGTTTSGPGFIGGNVTTGANRGTSVGIPAVGLLIFAVNTTTQTLMQQTYTDANGNYSFSNLPVGTTYEIYPEAINYATTAYTSITLTSSASSMSAADFIQHTVSHTITPIVSGIRNIAATASSVITYPNPTTGKLNIQWNDNLSEKGTVVITDITGREMLKTNLNMNQGTGSSQVDLSGLSDGVYIVNVRSGSINYNNKIQVLH